MSHPPPVQHPRALSKLAATGDASVAAGLDLTSDMSTQDTLAAAKRAREARRSRSRAESMDAPVSLPNPRSDSPPEHGRGAEQQLTQPSASRGDPAASRSTRQLMTDVAHERLASSSSSSRVPPQPTSSQVRGQAASAEPENKTSNSPRLVGSLPSQASSMSFYRGSNRPSQEPNGTAAIPQRDRSASLDGMSDGGGKPSVPALPPKRASMSFRRAGSTSQPTEGGNVTAPAGGQAKKQPVPVPVVLTDSDAITRAPLPRRSLSFHRDSSRNAVGAQVSGEMNPLGGTEPPKLPSEDARRSSVPDSGSVNVSGAVPPRSMSFRRAGSSITPHPNGVLRKEGGSSREQIPQNLDLARDVLPARSRSVRFSAEQQVQSVTALGAGPVMPATADATSSELRIECLSCAELQKKYAQLADDLDHLERELRVKIREEQKYQAEKEKKSWFGTRPPTGERGLLKTEINKLHVTVLYLYDRLEN
ncbi:hypothetical protein FVE85_1581 [Porphyridium purpureum]|uniref:Uncharacterized protein n=1 Tax=Porphyridium purpureum TaxID=35688 RepID=A0A5J4YVN7_PORPP|nr:hypothetical protein FVE85_1581 [Porphyridium purpureum]|eukprot:POR7967..scf209_3